MNGTEMDLAQIRELARLLDEVGLTEIEVETNGARVRLARQPAPVAAAPSVFAPAAASPAAISATAALAAEPVQHPGAVTSPMVGTAYVAPEPGGAPFVQVGDTVIEGQTLLIIEAMKTMNPIPAPRSGRVTRILMTDAQPVEFGEVLLILE